MKNGSLYERMGGGDNIARIVDHILELHLANPLVAHRFRDADPVKVKRLAWEFFCAGSGGPQQYTGRDLRTAHTGMSISEEEFVTVVDDIAHAMDRVGIGTDEKNEVLGMLRSMKGEIVGL